ncbi:ABC transporter ATP-binding protein [Acetobacteroides hydrogenigenes]|uniref:Lipoprotein-releasing system ATP-binding protein n=1 Tax=Acetobacteroides hydrogenigenes TaxID=979970 RepID=A0A4R2EMB7_9BACT|nr:ABC transporter ATP-binding protein [Acetobacteroides hydrogenigenes]TCN70258.1 lipoprotein-releasing system ATP-binding protein [Acetobacteroides hydrogenigenes]
MISVKNIRKVFGQLEVLKGINLDIESNQVVSIVGASGAGKTTLLQIMGSLLNPSSGDVLIDGANICLMTDKELSSFRNEKIGFVFQQHHLLPEFTAFENVCIPGYIARKDNREVEQQAKELLELLGLSHRLSHRPQELSGGEQQRVAIARALINNPSVIFADEPSGNLDSHNKQELHSLFFKLRDQFGHTFVVVTHDLELAKMSDRIITLNDGQVVNG